MQFGKLILQKIVSCDFIEVAHDFCIRNVFTAFYYRTALISSQPTHLKRLKVPTNVQDSVLNTCSVLLTCRGAHERH